MIELLSPSDVLSKVRSIHFVAPWRLADFQKAGNKRLSKSQELQNIARAPSASLKSTFVDGDL